MNKSILALSLLVASGCASPQARIPGQTLVNASPRLKRDAVRAVATYEMALSPYRGPLPVVDTQVIQPPGEIAAEQKTDLVHAKWSERWLVKRDGTNFPYRLQFTAEGSKGTDILVGIDTPNFGKSPAQVIDIK